ncbi:ATP-dependent DNA helicase hus2/rqh1 [Fusarium oxysporum f. sp. albedinis]|nr:ATP-dependent DNA helicase hus2/rqh1 [Fusarium oxysporum f. sp. albedinis]
MHDAIRFALFASCRRDDYSHTLKTEMALRLRTVITPLAFHGASKKLISLRVLSCRKSASPIVLNMPRQFAIVSHDGKQLEVSEFKNNLIYLTTLNQQHDIYTGPRGGLSPPGAPDRNSKIHRSIPCTTG